MIARADRPKEPHGMIPPEASSTQSTRNVDARGYHHRNRRQPAADGAARPVPRAPGPFDPDQGPERLLRQASHVIKGLTIEFPANQATALIGPSGSGKSTVVRCINRMHEEIPGARADGSVKLDETELYDPNVDVTAVRQADRDGVPEAESVPDDVDLRQRRRGPAADRDPFAATYASSSMSRCAPSASGTRSRIA